MSQVAYRPTGSLVQLRERGPAGLTIEKGVPMPAPKQRRGEVGATLAKMVPGDSIVLPQDSHVYDIAKKLGIRVVSREIEDGRFRVWRCA